MSDYKEKPMTKEDAKHSVKEMGDMMEWFDGICERCGEQRKNCSMECMKEQPPGEGESTPNAT